MQQEQGLRRPTQRISCGIDLEDFHVDGDLDRSVIRAGFGLDPRQVLLLFVGRVDHEKLLDVPIRALARAECAGIQLALSRQRAEAHAWPAVLDRFEGLYAASIASGATGFAVVE